MTGTTLSYFGRRGRPHDCLFGRGRMDSTGSRSRIMRTANTARQGQVSSSREHWVVPPVLCLAGRGLHHGISRGGVQSLSVPMLGFRMQAGAERMERDCWCKVGPKSWRSLLSLGWCPEKVHGDEASLGLTPCCFTAQPMAGTSADGPEQPQNTHSVLLTFPPNRSRFWD